jgi:hypothetical protein
VPLRHIAYNQSAAIIEVYAARRQAEGHIFKKKRNIADYSKVISTPVF